MSMTISDVAGFQLQDHYLTEAEEASLIEWIDQQPWDTTLRRRVQHYGYRYDYTARDIDAALFLGELPGPLGELAKRLTDEGYLKTVPDQLIINEYEPGQGIAAHVDCIPCFGPQIASISLGSHVGMDFISLTDQTKISQTLLARSLLVFSDTARYEWKHGIAARKSDLIEGERVPRSRRISLTFRLVKKD
ncbi:2OG-Fe(II) oxygenase superfamily protein [Gimesia panareensis]|uniref:2OG-Fe(II) oxygenase superfamily protein n=1 Tax=Gimesia panareensis TaxID=2527978 RepID=A0A518FQW8_9PLAN|nr:alpha-ketoglutarate-dependent dioxygenase AlkB [Gimesia panareensis]QDV18660.1 2OG-Fe(II) oxygenase superfamily protein [Gimesia panareensis]